MGGDACVKRQLAAARKPRKGRKQSLVFEFVLNYSTSLFDVTGHPRWEKCHSIENC